MSQDDNKHNVLYFEGVSMRELYKEMDNWQKENRKRFLSATVQSDNGLFCCIALTNPTEVSIVGGWDEYGTTARVSGGRLQTG